jgi:hypothetical protein
MIGHPISDYRTEEKLGGAMGVVSKAVVYKVKDTSRGRVVALKFHPDDVFELQGGRYEALETDFS